MKKMATIAKELLFKYGHIVACCAFAFVAIAANSSCGMPFYEPEEPAELAKFKKA